MTEPDGAAEIPEIREILDAVIEDHDLDEDVAHEILTRAKQESGDELDDSLRALLEGAIR